MVVRSFFLVCFFFLPGEILFASSRFLTKSRLRRLDRPGQECYPKPSNQIPHYSSTIYRLWNTKIQFSINGANSNELRYAKSQCQGKCILKDDASDCAAWTVGIENGKCNKHIGILWWRSCIAWDKISVCRFARTTVKWQKDTRSKIMYKGEMKCPKEYQHSHGGGFGR